MQKFSLHTHTIGFDGRNTEEEMLTQAVALGWRRIGFSNHFIVHPEIKAAPMYAYAVRGGYDNIYAASFDEAIARFLPHYKKIDELRRQTDVQILKGMEVDFFAAPESVRHILLSIKIRCIIRMMLKIRRCRSKKCCCTAIGKTNDLPHNRGCLILWHTWICLKKSVWGRATNGLKMSKKPLRQLKNRGLRSSSIQVILSLGKSLIRVGGL